MAARRHGSDVLCNKVWGFGNDPIIGPPVGTEEDSSGRHPSVLHRFVIWLLRDLIRLTEAHRHCPVDC